LLANLIARIIYNRRGSIACAGLTDRKQEENEMDLHFGSNVALVNGASRGSARRLLNEFCRRTNP
jgi:hypothetical protein